MKKPLKMLVFKGLFEEAPPGFEPGNRGFAIRCLSRLATAPEYSMNFIELYLSTMRSGDA